MDNDYSWVAGAGIGFFFLALVIYLAILGLFVWVGYLLMRTAVKNGVILALRETGQALGPGHRPGGYPPAGPPTPGRYGG